MHVRYYYITLHSTAFHFITATRTHCRISRSWKRRRNIRRRAHTLSMRHQIIPAGWQCRRIGNTERSPYPLLESYGLTNGCALQAEQKILTVSSTVYYILQRNVATACVINAVDQLRTTMAWDRWRRSCHSHTWIVVSSTNSIDLAYLRRTRMVQLRRLHL